MDGSGYIDGPEDSSARQLTRRELKQALEVFAEPNTVLGIANFTIDWLMYAACLAGVVLLEPMWAKITLSILAGVKLANIGTLGHEAAHGNVVRSPLLNKIIAVGCFLPCNYNYRLWIYDHHHLHHPFTNADHYHSWAPLSKAQYDALPGWKKALHRHYRNSWGLGLASYNIIERWAPVHLIPRAFLPKVMHASAWRHFAVMMVYTAALAGILAAAPLYSSTSTVTALVLGMVVPFYIWMLLFAFTVYVQHTDKRLPWFDVSLDRKSGLPQEALSTHIQFPKILRVLMHNVYEHAVHHVNVRIPYHRAADAQKVLNELAPETAVVEPFSFKWLHETLRDCRLYDFEGHRWLDWNGNPTSEVTLTEEQRVEVRLANAVPA